MQTLISEQAVRRIIKEEVSRAVFVSARDRLISAFGGRKRLVEAYGAAATSTKPPEGVKKGAKGLPSEVVTALAGTLQAIDNAIISDAPQQERKVVTNQLSILRRLLAKNKEEHPGVLRLIHVVEEILGDVNSLARLFAPQSQGRREVANKMKNRIEDASKEATSSEFNF